MAGLGKFFRDRRGGMVERVAVLAGAIALASISGAHFLDVASRDGASQLYAWLGKNTNIDYTSTATIHKPGQIVLDPCTGKSK